MNSASNLLPTYPVHQLINKALLLHLLSKQPYVEFIIGVETMSKARSFLPVGAREKKIATSPQTDEFRQTDTTHSPMASSQ